MVYMRSQVTSRAHFATPLIARQVSKKPVYHAILTEKHITKQQNVNYATLSHHKNGIKFISVYPKNMENLDWVFRKKFETVTGNKLPH